MKEHRNYSLNDIVKILQKVEEIKSPEIFPNHNNLEQYETPHDLIVKILSLVNTNVKNSFVIDLGCGKGGIILGSVLLGAKGALGIDIDESLLTVARKAALEFDIRGIHWIIGSVEFLPLKKGFYEGNITVVMNPPFGTKKRRGIDRAFLLQAFKFADTVVSLHRYNPKSLETFKTDAKSRGWNLSHHEILEFPLNPTERYQQVYLMKVSVLVFHRQGFCEK